MSDNAAPPKPRMTILAVSPEDFVRFMAAKGTKNDECPVCGNDNWSVLCTPDDEPVYRLGTPVRNRKEEFYLSTFGYFCDNCGLIRQHMAAVVHKWVSENPAPIEEMVDRVESSSGINLDE
ncbi:MULTISPECIES: hypothetical protein [Pseudomonas]|uniref:hypothetical protein n=1 Tax=Pseudomonas TaxID=286 RepID=UPI00257CA5DA|nr:MULTISPECIES: hypothetical protein [Pseudomonas]MDP9539327.1 hypothetical protein [Pseudomonas putida]MDV5386564.1 hypothetical protein [Pseudomonas juntendi]